ncbi:ABC transporter substrate-binding protein [bacterium AH-315-F03]|nr:ABC transporter substrate-binding protein [bacterium AH-315-F03]
MHMRNYVWKFSMSLALLFLVFFGGVGWHSVEAGNGKQRIHALYIPLADHYAALVAYERYRDKMVYADFQIEKMKSWDLLRAYFQSGDADMAYVMSPLAMDMYLDNPHFRWIGLMHRDGNALAINSLLKDKIDLPSSREDRKPSSAIAELLIENFRVTGKATEIGMPHLLATHTVVLYRYLKEHGATLSITPNLGADVLAIAVSPPKSPAFLRSKSNRAQPAAFEQSLPWADVVETGGFGHVAWYSKDVMPWPHGHVECIALATDRAIANKNQAIREVMSYIHQAGRDIELARKRGGEELDAIIKIVRRHIPAHTPEAIIASLDPKLRVINYEYLNVDKLGIKQIMDLAIEGGIMRAPIDIDEFADEQFGTEQGRVTGIRDGERLSSRSSNSSTKK